jgi:hypothetical protein
MQSLPSRQLRERTRASRILSTCSTCRPFPDFHISEEPDASIAHVRICGRPGLGTTRVHPIPCFGQDG